MAWCYSFGVAIGDRDSPEPMLVVEGQARCRSADGEECTGRFPGCQTIIFAPGGRALQLKAIPRPLPAAHDNPAPAAEGPVEVLRRRVAALEEKVEALQRLLHGNE